MGHVYTYRYDAETATFVDGSIDSLQSRLHLNAKIHLQVHSDCDFTMKVHQPSSSGVQYIKSTKWLHNNQHQL